jgi:hypothetical protein
VSLKEVGSQVFDLRIKRARRLRVERHEHEANCCAIDADESDETHEIRDMDPEGKRALALSARPEGTRTRT